MPNSVSSELLTDILEVNFGVKRVIDSIAIAIAIQRSYILIHCDIQFLARPRALLARRFEAFLEQDSATAYIADFLNAEPNSPLGILRHCHINVSV